MKQVIGIPMSKGAGGRDETKHKGKEGCLRKKYMGGKQGRQIQ